MGTFKSNKITSLPARQLHAGANVEVALYSGSASFSAGDIVQVTNIANGGRVVDVQIIANNLSASIGPTVSVGDGNDTGRFVATATVNATVVGRMNLVGGANYEYTADDTVDVLIAGPGGDPTAQPNIVAIITTVYDN